jgi:hypothetical protein
MHHTPKTPPHHHHHTHTRARAFAVLSSEAVMRLLPSCENATLRTVPVCALRMVERPSLWRVAARAVCMGG